MHLILWRHAEAEEGIPDWSRSLTPKGHIQAEKMAAFLRGHLPSDTRILVSPAMRAQQTATAFNRHFITEPTIMPGCSPQDVLQAANWPNETGCVLVVGHQPSLGETASLIMTGKEQHWGIKKSAVWWFSLRKRDHYAQAILQLAASPEFLN